MHEFDIENGETKCTYKGKTGSDQRRKRHKLLIKELLLDYMKNSTLHGLRYISERGLSVVEKIFWLLTFLLSVALCFFLISNVWIKWQTSPVIVTVSEKLVPVGMVPFPTVTICPQIKMSQNAYNFTQEYNKHRLLQQNGKQEYSGYILQTMEILEDISLVCDPGEFKYLQLKRKFGNSSIVDLISKVAPRTLVQCRWQDVYSNCSTLFKPVLTSDGVCYSFNALAANEMFTDNIQKDYAYLDTSEPSRNWSAAEDYTNFDADPYPRRGRDNGVKADLFIVLDDLSSQRDALCNSFYIGYKIYIQHPSDLPQASFYYYTALPRQRTSMALSFDMRTTSNRLRSYSPEVRQCYFPSDRPLRYFRIYTANNCRLECLSDYTFQECGCVMFHMPHNDSRTICTIASRECANKAQERLTDEELKADLGYKANACRCLPACYSVVYDADVQRTDVDYETFVKSYYDRLGFDNVNGSWPRYTVLDISFKEPYFMAMRRSELFGMTDFLANCGGILGLFLSFSVLSLVEIAYFFTLRLCCILKRDVQKDITVNDTIQEIRNID